MISDSRLRVAAANAVDDDDAMLDCGCHGYTLQMGDSSQFSGKPKRLGAILGKSRRRSIMHFGHRLCGAMIFRQ
jgi:hypothetical protein